MFIASSPEVRITPIAPPCAVAIAQMVDIYSNSVCILVFIRDGYDCDSVEDCIDNNISLGFVAFEFYPNLLGGIVLCQRCVIINLERIQSS